MEIEPEEGWGTVWEGPLLALVVVLAFLVAGLQFAMQFSRCAWGGGVGGYW